MSIEQFFDAQLHNPIPPDARRWVERIKKARAAHQDVSCYLDREREGLSYQPATLILYAHRSGEDEEIGAAMWSLALHEWLLLEGIRSQDLQNEAERFGMALHEHLSPVEIHFGNGFFSSVLVTFLREHGFEDVKSSHEILSKINVNNPQRSEDALICQEMIQDVIVKTATSLKALGYNKEEREAILAEAVAYYLDERFSITNGRLLGLW